MVEEGPYEILPYAEIDDLRSEVNKVKKDNSSSDEVLDAVKRLTTIMENMLLLFQGAAKGMKEKKDNSIEKKMNDVLDQQETLAQSLVSLVELVKEIKAELKQVKQPPILQKPNNKFSSPKIKPKPSFPQPPAFERSMQRPTPPPQQPNFMAPPPMQNKPSMPPPPPGLGPDNHTHQHNGNPSLMPTGDFKDLDKNLGDAIKPDSPKKEKKGLFGITFKK